MRIATWTPGDPEMRWGNPNLIWGSPSYLRQPGDVGYVPPSPPTPTINNMTNHKLNCPVPVLTFNGNLIVAAGLKYPAVAARLPDGYITATTTALGKLPADTISQKTATGETGNLTAAQKQNLVALVHWMNQARKTAHLAFFGQDVKLHQEFLVGVHEDHTLPAVLSRADIILASVQSAANLAALKLRGWTDADTQKFVAVRATFPASSVTQKSGQSDAQKATVAKTSDASDAYEHVLTVQHAGDLEYPATDPANAPIRAEFRLGLFPPYRHTTHDTPAPAPAPTPTPTPPTK